MNTFGNYPEKYLLFNAQTSKNLSIVMQIEGLDTLYGIGSTFTYVRYGDPGIVYGLPGLVYGGLRNLTNVKPYLILDSSLSITQRIEPEQGKGSVGTLTLNLIDYNGEVSLIVAPGIVLDEIIQKREFRIWLGFTQTSFPDDYLLLYRGYCTQTVCPPGRVQFQVSDTITKKRQPIFQVGTSNLSSSIDSSQTNIPTTGISGFYEQILGPDGTYDPLVGTFIRIDDEIMNYGVGDISGNTITVTRGVIGSAPATHDNDASITNTLQLGYGVDGINCIELALKILLSGWDGPCETGVSLQSFVYTYSDLGFVSNAFLLLNQDAVLDYGLSIGDYFYISGASNSGNNVSGRITGFADAQVSNQIIYTDQTFILENPTSATSDFRSQYDTFPVAAGLGLRMRDVDVATFQYVQTNYFNAATTSNMQFYLDEATSGKDFIDVQILFPVGCYSISRFGRVSVSITKPPLPGVGKMVQLDYTNVIDPDKIQVTRSANSRSFYNVIQYTYDKDPVSGNYGTVNYAVDSVSLTNFNQTAILPITADGLKSSIGGGSIVEIRSNSLLNRYKNCTTLIELTCNWSVGSLIEVSDIVLLIDNGNLKIMNYDTGERNLQQQLFEVIDRSYNLASGNVKLKLLGGVGFSINSRFALISPSSQLDTSSTSSLLKLKPSYGQTSVVNELFKWNQFVGLPIQVHSSDWSVLGTSIITGVGDVDPTALSVSPPLGFTPPENYIVDIGTYPTSTNKNENSLYKLLYTYLTPTISVVSGTSDTVFDVSPSDAANMTVGNSIIVRKDDYSVISPEVIVSTIVSGTITTQTSLGFTPDSTYFVEGIGFKDGQSFYRYG